MEGTVPPFLSLSSEVRSVLTSCAGACVALVALSCAARGPQHRHVAAGCILQPALNWPASTFLRFYYPPWWCCLCAFHKAVWQVTGIELQACWLSAPPRPAVCFEHTVGLFSCCSFKGRCLRADVLLFGIRDIFQEGILNSHSVKAHELYYITWHYIHSAEALVQSDLH